MTNDSIPPRYSRQVLFAPIGEEGQKKILASRVVVVGCGALGSMLASTMARAGCGELLIIDRDVLEESNLQRQILFGEDDVRRALPKAAAAAQNLRQINSTISIEGRILHLDHSSIREHLQGADLVLDGTDNFETRFLLNEACLELDIPWIYGACAGSYGLTMNILPGQTACLRCLFDQAPAPGSSLTCHTVGIIAPIAHIVASLQATEALKILTHQHNDLRRGILHIDLWENRFHPIALDRPHPDCPACQKDQQDHLQDQPQQSATLCGHNTVQISPPGPRSFDLFQLADRLAFFGPTTQNPFLVRCQIDPFLLTVFPDGRALIEGTPDLQQALSLYTRCLGS